MSKQSKGCPRCDQTGRPVEAITIESLLTSEARERLGTAKDFRFCRTSPCDVTYFQNSSGQQFVKADLSVPVFQKETDAGRPVCYCFDHSVASITAEVAESGGSVVPDEITDACRKGLDRCEELNPQGTCCLGNVRGVVKQARANLNVVQPAPSTGTAPIALARASDDPDCCDPEPVTTDAGEAAFSALAPKAPKAGLLSVGGAVGAAVLSSACCWLPLLLIGLGGSAVGIGGFFEAYRPHFLVLTVGLLGGGFYYIYIRKPKCGPDGECEVPNVKLQRFNKVMLWVAAAFVAAFALFPNYVGVLMGGDDNIDIIPVAAAATRTYDLEGMTCEACGTTIRAALQEVPGVATADVSYDQKTATVRFDPSTTPSNDAIVAAVKGVGYHATPRPPAQPDKPAELEARDPLGGDDDPATTPSNGADVGAVKGVHNAIPRPPAQPDKADELEARRDPLGGDDDEIDIIPVAAAATRTYDLKGMTCEACGITIRAAIQKVPGVATADVSYDQKTATVRFDPSTTPSNDAIVAAVKGVGYHATPRPLAQPDKTAELEARGDPQ